MQIDKRAGEDTYVGKPLEEMDKKDFKELKRKRSMNRLSKCIVSDCLFSCYRAQR